MRRAAWLASLPGGLLLIVALQPPAAAGDKTVAAGERSYQKCYSCHSLEGPDPRLQGPSLKGIVGREVAAEEGFAYSPAMRAYAGEQARWTREALDAFIADPMTVVPRNEMGFFGIAGAEERRALVAYLADS
jgi:cytochrome c2